MNYFSELAFNFIDVILLLYLAWEMTGRKNISKEKLVVIIILETLINVFVNTYLGTTNFLGFIIKIPITAILFNLVLQTSILSIYTSLMLGLVLMTFSEVIVSAFILLLTGESPAVLFQNHVYNVIGAIFSKSFYLTMVICAFRKLKKSKKDYFTFIFKKENRYSILLLSVINMIVLVYTFIFYKYTFILKGYERVFIFVIAISVIVLTVLISRILWKIVDYAQREVEWKEKEEAYKKQLFYMNNMEEAMNSIRAQRHDFKNHIGCIYGLLMLEKNKEALGYVKRFTNEVAEYDVLLSTGNPTVTALLNMKLIKARVENINFETIVDLPENIGLDVLDISIILGNLVDNAIEACTQVQDRYIDLLIYQKGTYLIIKIENSKRNDIKVDLSSLKEKFTTKEQDKGDHGFGLYNISQIVNKYDGMFEIEDNIDTFNVNITIPISIKDKNISVKKSTALSY